MTITKMLGNLALYYPNNPHVRTTLSNSCQIASLESQCSPGFAAIHSLFSTAKVRARASLTMETRIMSSWGNARLIDSDRKINLVTLLLSTTTITWSCLPQQRNHLKLTQLPQTRTPLSPTLSAKRSYLGTSTSRTCMGQRLICSSHSRWGSHTSDIRSSSIWCLSSKLLS